MDEQRKAELTAQLLDAKPQDQVVPVASKPLLTINQLAAIARDIAINVYDLEDIIRKYDITPAQYTAHVLPNGYFQKLLRSYTAEWESIPSTNKRIALQAGAALEESLPALAHRMGSKSEDLADVIATARLFTQLAGAGAGPGNTTAEAGQRFSIQINIGDHTVSLEAGEQSSRQEDISENTEISGHRQSLLELTPGERDTAAGVPPAGDDRSAPTVSSVPKGDRDDV
jgi:hypothetical protein